MMRLLSLSRSPCDPQDSALEAYHFSEKDDVAAKVQQLPQVPWSFTAPTAPTSRQSTLTGRSSRPGTKDVYKGTQILVCLFIHTPRSTADRRQR